MSPLTNFTKMLCDGLIQAVQCCLVDSNVKRKYLVHHFIAFIGFNEFVSFRQNVKEIYSNPDVANQVEQETEIQRLRYKMEELIRETKKLAAENQYVLDY